MISYIKMFKYDPSKERYVSVFGNRGFGLGFAGLFEEGIYDSIDMKKDHHIDKAGYARAASSFVVPEGLVAYFYKDEYKKDTPLVIQGPQEVDFMADNSPYADWNDQVRGLTVISLRKATVLTKWERVLSSNGPISLSIEKGWNKSESKKDEEAVKYELNYTAEGGFNYMGASAT